MVVCVLMASMAICAYVGPDGLALTVKQVRVTKHFSLFLAIFLLSTRYHGV